MYSDATGFAHPVVVGIDPQFPRTARRLKAEQLDRTIQQAQRMATGMPKGGASSLAAKLRMRALGLYYRRHFIERRLEGFGTMLVTSIHPFTRSVVSIRLPQCRHSLRRTIRPPQAERV